MISLEKESLVIRFLPDYTILDNTRASYYIDAMGSYIRIHGDHTSGPWSTYGLNKQHVRTNGQESEFRLYKINHQADASLIAAAPDMLKILKKILNFKTVDHKNLADLIDKAEGYERVN